MEVVERHVLRVESLTKRFGGKTAVDDVSFSVRREEIIGILGPNGAGKSTLMHMLPGLIKADSGDIVIFGKRLRDDRSRILSRMNIVSPYAALPGSLTVMENLLVYAGLYGMRRPVARIGALLDRLGVATLASIPLSRLSSGQVTRVGLCKALMNDPDLLLLDEPTAYLDPDIASRTYDLLLEHRRTRGMTILLTSHDITEIELLCDRTLLLRSGQVAAFGTSSEVTQSVLGAHGPERSLRQAFLHLARGR